MPGEIQQIAPISSQSVGARAALGAHHVEKGLDQMPGIRTSCHGLDLARSLVYPGAMLLTKTVALVGMMGAGKTSIGKRLATRLEVPFADADQEIEAAADMSVAEIFAKYGEAEFRRLERNVIARLLHSKPLVLATGGGPYMDQATRAAMKDAAFTIWLKA